MAPTQNRDFAQILVLVDRLPSFQEEGPSRRLAQLLFDLRSLGPSARTVVAALDRRASPALGAWHEAGLELAPPDLDWSGWLARHRFSFSLVVFAGSGVSRWLVEEVRRTQPQALQAALLSSLPVPHRGEGGRFGDPEERAGAAYVINRRLRSDRGFLAGLDVALAAGDDELARAASAGGVAALRYPTARRPGPRPGHAGRRGVVAWARFGAEAQNPDEDGLVWVSDIVAAVVGRLQPGLPFEATLADAPTGLAPLLKPGRDLAAVLREALVLVIPRRFGRVYESLVDEAADAGTPVVGLDCVVPSDGSVVACADGVDLARRAVELATDEGAWGVARAGLDRRWDAASPEAARRVVAELLARAGIAPLDPGAPVAMALPAAPSAPATRPGPRTVQGQVQSAGFVERRPTAAAYRTADIRLADLWPDIGYSSWFDAHGLDDHLEAEVRRACARFRYAPTISIVMPVYDTDPDVLEATVRSVLDQLYGRWELCVVDDASVDAGTVARLAELAGADDRIKSVRLPANGGIVAASNAALALATGEFVAFLDHDDLLTPDALFEVVALLNEEDDLDYLYSDEDKLDLDGARTSPFFKPSWSPHLHLGVNYVTHLSVYRRALLDRIGGLRPGFDGSQDYDLALRATEAARRIGHVAKPIYTWRMVPGSTAVAHDAKPYALDAARRALDEALARRGLDARVQPGLVPGTWRPRYSIRGDPLVSILIPTRNGHQLLRRCLESLEAVTDYEPYEVVIIDNASDDPETLDFLSTVKARVVRYPYRFNYARQMNLAVDEAHGELMLFLNNDVEVISPGWMTAMVELTQDFAVGAVGARLLFPSGRPQHEGVFVGFGGGSAGNVDFGGYFRLGELIRDATAVTAACMMMRLDAFRRVGGFDERLSVAFNDVDLCLRLRQAGYQVVYTPYAELYHAESASRGALHPVDDEAFFVRRWGAVGAFRDPFYNPNLDPARPFRLRR